VWLTRFCLANPVAVTLFYALVGVAGIASALLMGRSVLPPISLPVVTISAPYAGAGPAEIERLVIEPMEDELTSVPALEAALEAFLTRDRGRVMRVILI